MTGTNRFGDYLRKLRESRNPKITQEQLGDAVGKKKMTISQIESGKNAPPQGDFLEAIINAMDLSDEEEVTLRDLAALARGAIPSDILEYFNKTSGLRSAIRKAMQRNYTDADWNNMIK
ncbi:helix-turn-helix domain-containing protein [Ruminiclostridium cellobioparum]|uniref:helix-turn-helix domain-containing protein n=1 Tax=Ruminiclostridium cellobioparum TaxID=29355 RepID=UPI0028AEE318|nr:helix-turn-helix transcriptional regulator [Ruminiclostridium cellobioparum]